METGGSSCNGRKAGPRSYWRSQHLSIASDFNIWSLKRNLMDSGIFFMEIAALVDGSESLTGSWWPQGRVPIDAWTLGPQPTPCTLWLCGAKDFGLVWTDLAVWVYLGWTLGRREGSQLFSKLDPLNQSRVGFELARTWSRIWPRPTGLWPWPAPWPWLILLVSWERWCLCDFPPTQGHDKVKPHTGTR